MTNLIGFSSDGSSAKLDEAIETLFKNGGLPAKGFGTKAKMTTDGAAIPDGGYAQVTDDTVNNGLYVKTAGAWVKSSYDPSANAIAYVDANPLFNPTNLKLDDNLKNIGNGVFAIPSPTIGNSIIGMPPVSGLKLGLVTSYKVGAMAYQRFCHFATSEQYERTGNGSSSSFDYLPWAKVVKKSDIIGDSGKLDSANLDSIVTTGLFLQNSNTTPSTALNYPVISSGFLLVFKSSASTVITQIYFAHSGGVYTRKKVSDWSVWATSGGSVTPPTSVKIGFAFEKTADKLDFYQKGTGDNSIKFSLVKKVVPATNLDTWGMTAAQEVNGSGVVVRDITSNGVWECALKDFENADDHSGGSHGDEVKQAVVFIIDGSIVDETTVMSGQAKEIKFAQTSEIYVQDSLVKMADKVVEWTFTADKLNMKQTITPVVGRRLTSTWIAMLPVLRKANANNTGEQITDKEVRSTDWEVIDISEPAFTRKVQDIKEGDNITLSGTASKVSASLRFNNFTLPSPQMYVQENIQFNKIYVAASTVNTSRVIEEGEKWYIDVDYVVSTNN